MIMVTTRGANKAHSVTIHRTGAERERPRKPDTGTAGDKDNFADKSVSKFFTCFQVWVWQLEPKKNQSSQQCGFHSGVVFNVVLTVEWNVFSINSPSRCGSQVIY